MRTRSEDTHGRWKLVLKAVDKSATTGEIRNQIERTRKFVGISVCSTLTE